MEIAEIGCRISEALSFDSQGQHQEAFEKYVESLDILLAKIREAQGTDEKEGGIHAAILKYIELAQHCVERMTAILYDNADKRDDAKEDSHSCSLEEDLFGSSMEYLTGSASARVSLDASLAENPPGDPKNQPTSSSSSGIGMLGLAANEAVKKITDYGPVYQAAKKNQNALSLYESRVKFQQPRSAAVAVDMNLSLLRKMHENMAIAKSQQKSMISALTNPPLSQRRESSGLAKNESVVRELLSKRQRLHHRINEKVQEFMDNLSAKARDTQAELVTRAEEEIWHKSLQKALASAPDDSIIVPIVEALGPESHHPLAIVTKDLMNRERFMLREARCEESTDAKACFTSKVIEEIHLFSYNVVKLLEHNYDELRSGQFSLAIELSVEHYFFTSPLSSALMHVLQQQYCRRDTALSARFIELGWDDSYSLLSIKPRLQISALEEDEPYGRAILEIRQLGLYSTPFEKMMCLIRTCNLICQAVENHTQYRKSSTKSAAASPPAGAILAASGQPRRSSNSAASALSGPSEESALGSEDLLLLFAYVLLRARLSHAASEFAFVSELVPEQMIRGEAGYVLATMQTALAFLEQLPFSEASS